ncbi:hypothetical protein [Brevundimonas sp.]|uniref:hypothetical protein n=1 Tax=Brevundimonas sp. TaxID=1871086 RepID=UPI002FC8C674
MLRYLLFVLTLCLGACAMPQADPDRVGQATQVYGWVRDGDIDSLAKQSTPSLRPQLTPDLMAGVRRYASPGAPQLSKVLSWRSNTVAGGASLYEVVQQLEYPERTVIVQVLMVREGNGPWLVDGFHLNAVSPTLAKASTGFSLEGKSPLHYGALIGVVLVPLLCLVTAGVAGWRRRWAWMIFSLFGFGQLALNWNTGEWQFQTLYFAILSAGFFKGVGPLDPWVLMLSLPIPAALFWILRRDRPKAKAGKKALSTPIPHPVDEA